jgi:hypothetical integral membrane protein (TIGR02206 family)
VADPEFYLYGPAHLGVLGVVAAWLVIGVVVARAGRWPLAQRNYERVLGVALLLTYPSKLVVTFFYPSTWDYPLPCHVCDAAAFLGLGALVLRSVRLAELVYFWGVAGTVQGLVTPAVQVGFPHPEFHRFFLLHGSVVVAALYLPFGAGLVPRPGAPWRAWGWIQVYLVIAAVTNWLTGANYGFLREPPPSASLIDLLGPWPWYLVSLQVIALAFFWALDLPLWFLRRRPWKPTLPS